MNVMELGAIGELVGGVAVIGSLIFVGIQIRANTRTVSAESSTRSQLEWSNFNWMVSQHPHRETIARLFDPQQTLSAFSPEERVVVVFSARSFAQQVEAMFYQFRAGLLDSEVWDVRLRGFATLLRSPAFGEWWGEEQKAPVYTASFLAAVGSAQGTEIASDVLAGVGLGREG